MTVGTDGAVDVAASTGIVDHGFKRRDEMNSDDPANTIGIVSVMSRRVNWIGQDFLLELSALSLPSIPNLRSRIDDILDV